MHNQRGEVVTGVMVVMKVVMMIFGGACDGWGGTGPKEITTRWRRSTITMRTERNTCIRMLKGKIPPPLSMKPGK